LYAQHLFMTLILITTNLTQNPSNALVLVTHLTKSAQSIILPQPKDITTPWMQTIWKPAFYTKVEIQGEKTVTTLQVSKFQLLGQDKINTTKTISSRNYKNYLNSFGSTKRNPNNKNQGKQTLMNQTKVQLHRMMTCGFTLERRKPRRS